MRSKQYAITGYTTAEDIKKIRKKLNLTQKEFAGFVGVSKPTVERWEVEKGRVTGPIGLLINILDDHPDYLEQYAIPEREGRLRLYYMHKEKICTIIDVDDSKRKVNIRNYVEHTMFKAFGNLLEPTYDDYIEFLKSRTFPETRDKLKLVLKDLDLPFYDPFMVVEKTEGRMAEDDFWIRIER